MRRYMRGFFAVKRQPAAFIIIPAVLLIAGLMITAILALPACSGKTSSSGNRLPGPPVQTETRQERTPGRQIPDRVVVQRGSERFELPEDLYPN